MNKTLLTENRADFVYLFDLQMSGKVNMFGAANYLQRDRRLSKNKAKEVLLEWMTHYDEIAKELEKN